MSVFQELSNEHVDQREQNLLDYWREIDLLKRSVEVREGSEPYIFYEGPPTANGKPGIHHVMARSLKDMTCRYKTMRGYKVNRKAGWDTHGLPVELEVEKKLGLHSKKEIEDYGIEAFNNKCKESVFEYESLWRKMTERMAFLVDMDDPYITMENKYIESVWYILNKMYTEGYIYEGNKILPYCPRCGTGLASHEVAQGYELDKTPTMVMKFKALDEDAYYLAWTTTPWTVPSNVALAMHPEVNYAKVKYADGNVYYLAQELLDAVLDQEYEVLEVKKGAEFEGRKYQQILPYVQVDKEAFFIVLGDHVTTEDGTGIVHTAPAFGEEDYEMGRKYDLPLVKPVDESGNFTETPWKGIFVHDSNDAIIAQMKEDGTVFKKETIEHNYPHCWRCHTPLIYYAHPSWYVSVTKYKDALVKNNQGVNWFPEFVGEKRFGNWLENIQDWALSRSRYWGTPIPLWRCGDCGKVRSIGSIAQLVEEAQEDITDEIELHRPYVDDVHLTCECGGTMTREKDVIDVWFDSGAMPFAQWHYPFEHKDDFDQLFPANFINEGIDQTRGWFYSLISISTFMTGKSPYKNVLVNDLILDKNGKKMSKSKGNTVNPQELFSVYGVDAVRWYLLYTSPPWMPTKFDEDGLKDVNAKFFRSLRNIFNMFTMYANINGVDPREEMPVEYEEVDRWILSRFNSLVEATRKDLDIFEVTKVVRRITDFVVEDWSNWYVRRNRRRFWSSEDSANRNAVFSVTYELLLGVAKLIAPMAPFISEEFYRALTGKESVHLADYPEVDESLIDLALEERMELVRTLVNLGRSAREAAKIKVRQPLSEILVDGDLKEVIGDMDDLIQEELNIKNIKYQEDLSEFMNYSLKPNFAEVGQLFGSKIRDFTKHLKSVDPKEFYNQLQEGGLSLVLEGEDTEIKPEYVLVDIEAKEGFNVAMSNNVFVILDTTITPELKDEGYLRELISKVQQLRKTTGLEVMDHIHLTLDAPEEIVAAIAPHRARVQSETLADTFEMAPGGEHEVTLNDVTAHVGLQKVED
ncbi:MAG: isoleucine--tRNA ligase [Tissierellia bacterium]|nr:isoleucine--tRNA ligase [Tissierellia bacterium]